jgi:Tol biopolymer transport system component/DNA-binding winged helix-turn-helix (wHTH) protein
MFRHLWAVTRLVPRPEATGDVYTQVVDAFVAGEWQISPSLNRISRGGEEVRLEPKVMQVLECLAATPGEVVSRDDLVARVWPGVFVTDDVLHRAIRELRRAFGDDTAKPAYVETIRKRGYRLIAPVRPINATPISLPSPAATIAPAASALLRTPPKGGGYSMVAASALLALTLGAVVYALASRPSAADATPTSVRFVAMTSSPLNESDPALSADGARLAFAMRPEGSDGPADIFIAAGAGQTPERLIAHPADDRYPAWSPDSATLAFVRIDGTTCDVMLMAMADRRERRLAACGNFEEPRVNWSANGEWLVESFAPGPDPMRGWQIARVSAQTGVREPLTLPAPATLGDYSPTVSPDGSRIAFVRGINGATADIFTIPFNGGAATRVTWDNQDLVGLDWSADGQSLVYATDRAGGYTIWRVPAAGGDSQLVVGGAAKLKHPSVARADGRISYESWSYEINLWEAPLVDRLDLEGDLTSTLRPVVQTSDQWNHSPDLSPDGQSIAFVSTRSGGAELWVAQRSGANARQLTTFGRASMRQPRWSPDGRRVLISAGVNGQMDLYAIEVASGASTRITDDGEDEVAPSWSGDGGVIFGARLAGSWQLMKLDPATGRRTQLTTTGGYSGQESPDRRSILFTRLEEPGVWTMPIGGGTPRLLVPAVRAAEYANFRVTANGIYYVGVTADQIVVRRAPLAGGAGVDVAWLGNYSWPGFAVTPDGRVLYGHWDRRESNIMAIDIK